MSNLTPAQKEWRLARARTAPLYPALPLSGWQGNPQPQTLPARLAAWLVQHLRHWLVAIH